MKRKTVKRILLSIIITVLAVLVIVLVYYLLQRFWAHREPAFTPDYEKVVLTEDSDLDTIFLQTGIGKPAAQKLIKKDKFDKILSAQEKFFANYDTECAPLLGWFTREDRLKDNKSTAFADLQKGDIILTLSTHSGGWRHGHAGLVVGKNKILECRMWGSDSAVMGTSYWRKYTNYAVLRIKDVTPELQKQIADYAKETLCNVPYSPVAGLFGEKAPDSESDNFTLQCAHLIWYACNNFGIDLDSDGGKLVTVRDLLDCELLEVVQIYGMDPRDFLS